jgi:prohibitin 2
MVDIGLRVLYRPEAEKIGFIAQTIGEDFSDKVLPSIIHDTLKSVMARYNAASLLTKRNEVKKLSFIVSIIFLKNRFLQQLELI